MKTCDMTQSALSEALFHRLRLRDVLISNLQVSIFQPDQDYLGILLPLHSPLFIPLPAVIL